MVQAPAWEARVKVAGSVVHVGVRVKVAGANDGAAWDFARAVVKRDVGVVVGGGWVGAPVARREVVAGSRQRRIRVVIASIGVRTSCTRHVFARSVAVVGVGVEVASGRIGAPKHQARHVIARSVIRCGGWVEVACQRIGATGVGKSFGIANQKQESSKHHRKEA